MNETPVEQCISIACAHMQHAIVYKESDEAWNWRWGLATTWFSQASRLMLNGL